MVSINLTAILVPAGITTGFGGGGGGASAGVAAEPTGAEWLEDAKLLLDDDGALRWVGRRASRLGAGAGAACSSAGACSVGASACAELCTCKLFTTVFTPLTWAASAAAVARSASVLV